MSWLFCFGQPSLPAFHPTYFNASPHITALIAEQQIEWNPQPQKRDSFAPKVKIYFRNEPENGRVRPTVNVGFVMNPPVAR
jgi:hypothetical protein